MYSLWTRWRGAAQTHETSGRIDSPHEALPLPDPERHDAASSSLPILLVDRPIVADIASLMDTYSNRSHDENLTQGLRPPRRAKAANLDPPVLDTMRNQMSPSPVNVPQQRGLHLQAGPSTSSVTRSEELSSSSSRRHLSRLSRQLASVSPWSTFGKRNDTELIHAATGQSVPPSAWHTGSFDSLVPRRSSSSKRKYAQSKQGSLTSLHRFASPSRASSDVLPSKSILSSSTRSSSSKIDEPNDHHEHDAFNCIYHHRTLPVHSLLGPHIQRSHTPQEGPFKHRASSSDPLILSVILHLLPRGLVVSFISLSSRLLHRHCLLWNTLSYSLR